MRPGSRILRGSSGPHPDGMAHQRRRRPKKRIGPYQSQAELFKAAQLDNPEKCQEALENGASINFHHDRWVKNERQAWGLRVPSYTMGVYTGFSSRLHWFAPSGVCVDKGDTLLMICIKCQMTNVVRWLLSKNDLDKLARNAAGNTAARLAPFYNMGYLFETDLSVPTLTAITESKNPPTVPYASAQPYPIPAAYAVPISDGLTVTSNTPPVVVGTAVNVDSMSYQYGGPAYGGSSTGDNSVVYSSSGAYGSSGAPTANGVGNYSAQGSYGRSGDYYSHGNA
eukprot:399992_1